MRPPSRRLFLIFHGRFPSEKAAALFAAKECEAFGKAGFSVTLLVPRRFGRIKSDAYAYYGLEKNFNIVYLPTLDVFWAGSLRSLAFKISFLVFSFAVFFYLLRRAHKTDLIYSNESLPMLLASWYFPNTLYELHDFPEGKDSFYGSLFRRVKFLLVTNAWKVDEVVRRFGIERKKILLERNAVEMSDFDVPAGKEESRVRLGLPKEGRIAVYTGHLYSWKGVDILAEAAKLLPTDVLVVFVGGTEQDLKRFRAEYGGVKNIRIVGHKNRSEIPYWQKAADVLILPNTAKEDISKYYTSPMKLFEYMASRVPIIASRIPSIEEIVTDDEVFFVPPDDAPALARMIQEVCGDATRGERKAQAAYQAVGEHTWQKRVARIVSFIKSAGEISGGAA